MGDLPKSREVTRVRLTSLLTPPPRHGPPPGPASSRGGGQRLSLLGGRGPSQLFSLFRSGGEGETRWPPSASISAPLAGGPVSPRRPPGGIWVGGAGDGRAGEMKARRLRPGNHHPLPRCPLLPPKAKSRARGGGLGPGGGGLPSPPPWNVRSRFSAAPLYPRQPAGGPGGTGRRVWAGEPGAVGGSPLDRGGGDGGRDAGGGGAARGGGRRAKKEVAGAAPRLGG